MAGFIHIDLGPARSWGERFPKRATAYAEETPPAREVLAESRTLKGSGAAGVATVGAAGVEVAQQVLAETQGAVLPLVPYLDTEVFRHAVETTRIILDEAEAFPTSAPTLFFAIPTETDVDGMTQTPVPQAVSCCGGHPAGRGGPAAGEILVSWAPVNVSRGEPGIGTSRYRRDPSGWNPTLGALV